MTFTMIVFPFMILISFYGESVEKKLSTEEKDIVR